MPGLDGFGVIEQIGAEQMPPVIFITAYDEYALRAFKVHAVEYLLKPLQEEDFMLAVNRARIVISQPSDESLKISLNALLESIQSERVYLERVLVKEKDRTKVIPVEDIDWIESQDNYISLHAGSSQYLVRNKISVMESRLNPKQFIRIHRSYIVKINQIRELEPLFNGDHIVHMKNGAKLPLSRTYYEKTIQRLQSHSA